VPFGYHRKGLCFGLGKWLEAINTKAPWHIMFHELWLGLNEKSSVKYRIWGAMQRIGIQNLITRLRPRIVHTQAEPYRIILNRERIKTSILPLFGNVHQIIGDGWNGLLEPLVTKALGRNENRSKLYLAGVFGRVPPEWNAEKTVIILLPLMQHFEKRLVLIFCGKNHLTPEAFSKIKLVVQNRADIVVTGERTSMEISKILQTIDLGIATTPHGVIQKSGSVAAMLEHGLQVLVTRDDWRLRAANFQMEEMSPGLLSPKQFALLETLPTRNFQLSSDYRIKQVASQLLEAFSLESA
jgi:hypothetical protein